MWTSTSVFSGTPFLGFKSHLQLDYLVILLGREGPNVQVVPQLVHPPGEVGAPCVYMFKGVGAGMVRC